MVRMMGEDNLSGNHLNGLKKREVSVKKDRVLVKTEDNEGLANNFSGL